MNQTYIRYHFVTFRYVRSGAGDNECRRAMDSIAWLIGQVMGTPKGIAGLPARKSCQVPRIYLSTYGMVTMPGSREPSVRFTCQLISRVIVKFREPVNTEVHVSCVSDTIAFHANEDPKSIGRR